MKTQMGQFLWPCPVCGVENTIDQGEGYFYIADSRCMHAKEIFADYKAKTKKKTSKGGGSNG